MEELFGRERWNFEETRVRLCLTHEELYAGIVEHENKLNDFNRHNGIKLHALADNYAEVRVELNEHTSNGLGIAHGGILFSICDVAAGYVTIARSQHIVTQGANINFLRTPVGKHLIAKAQPIKEGRTTSVMEVRVYDDTDRLVACATFTVFYI